MSDVMKLLTRYIEAKGYDIKTIIGADRECACGVRYIDGKKLPKNQFKTVERTCMRCFGSGTIAGEIDYKVTKKFKFNGEP